MRRREFVAFFGAAAPIWPLIALTAEEREIRSWSRPRRYSEWPITFDRLAGNVAGHCGHDWLGARRYLEAVGVAWLRREAVARAAGRGPRRDHHDYPPRD